MTLTYFSGDSAARGGHYGAYGGVQKQGRMEVDDSMCVFVPFCAPRVFKPAASLCVTFTMMTTINGRLPQGWGATASERPILGRIWMSTRFSTPQDPRSSCHADPLSRRDLRYADDIGELRTAGRCVFVVLN